MWEARLDHFAFDKTRMESVKKLLVIQERANDMLVGCIRVLDGYLEVPRVGEVFATCSSPVLGSIDPFFLSMFKALP